MNKFFTYRLNRNKYEGYRLLVEKSNFDCFKKIKYDSFEILYSNTELLHFQIDSQVIRRLKLLKLEEEIKLTMKKDLFFYYKNPKKEKKKMNFMIIIMDFILIIIIQKLVTKKMK